MFAGISDLIKTLIVLKTFGLDLITVDSVCSALKDLIIHFESDSRFSVSLIYLIKHIQSLINRKKSDSDPYNYG